MRFTAIIVLATGLMGALSSCNSSRPSTQTAISEPSAQIAESNTSATSASPPEESLSAQEVFPLTPGRHCYRLDDGITTTNLRLTLDKEARIEGEARSSVQNDEAAYYTSYTQAFAGTLDDTVAIDAVVDVTTWIEYDVQNTREAWILTSEALQTEDQTLDLVDCQLVDSVFQDDSGLESADLLDGATAVHRQRVEFAPGERAAAVSNAVVRGERDVYLLGASSGQQMELSIASLEDNAVFDVISPSGYILAREMMDETVVLPHTGDYQVIVGGTRGNASYELTIGIE
ncbi:hypothetical protein IQ260_13700 [Leptolyngbya cf. ectocarpi LEGE 11479]|uniref:Uncharacterized protein n=1 Tax=Leptolyngbya cf. ectocarpi LEGE 11479 TaxID=1828722 RepID=A0A928ZUM4_LEPEC|nr:hypothetical protein [Leptolyngbya ectocarpi]MBE9067710.1 hypothetical protein [Leptolyngbya cf. ectocarpi LEGE 11479]